MEQILVVEDDTVVRENLRDLLESEGFEVLSAENGDEGFKIAFEKLPDLILSDIRMPIVSGFDMLKKLQDNITTSDIPFIFLTAKVEHDEIRKGMTLGADDYLLKPYKRNDLLSAIDARLKKKRKIRENVELFKFSVVKRVQHELRTPLISILGLSELMLENIGSLTHEELSEIANKILDSGSRLLRRVEKLLVYVDLLLDESSPETRSKINENEYQVDQDFLAARLSETAAIFNRTDDLAVAFENKLLVITDLHFEFILKELLENSIKYSKQKSAINITGRSNGKYFITTVKDAGIGAKSIDAEKIGVFNQFGKEGETKEGLGLGLTIVKKIVELYGGYIKN